MQQKKLQEIRVLDGSTFFVSDTAGDSYGALTEGLFFHDTRFLSRSLLRVNGEKPELLSTKEVDYYSAAFFLTLPFNNVFESHPISIIRMRFVGHGNYEQISIQNFGTQLAELDVQLDFEADYADLFEVKNGTAERDKRVVEFDTDHLQQIKFTYQANGLFRQTVINFSLPINVTERGVVHFNVKLEPREQWSLDFSISPVWQQTMIVPKYNADSFGQARPEMKKSMQQWLAALPNLTTGLDDLFHTYMRSTVDLAALRFFPPGNEEPVLAAGLPWFMALFGRDNLITAYQCAYLAPELGIDALRSLAKRQGTKIDHFTDEEPGRIMHELRFDELTKIGKLPYSPYYGSADSTPLFLILLHEIYLWTADTTLVLELKENALRALEWIDKFGDRDGDGYVEYETHSPQGLRNQCWKDSWNSIMFADGRLAQTPIATVEIQGYVYAAKMRTAELAEKVWKDPQLARKLRAQAADLKKRFNKDFWVDRDGGFLALALDRDKKQVDSQTSNMGQALLSGIVADDKVAQIVSRLFADDLYSGWGIRTMSKKDAGYNPIAYHNGTVWPHDNSLIAAGLVHCGYRKEANRILLDMLKAAHFFQHRLPEVFAGYATTRIDCPVEYPTASCPQAWATGAPILFIRNVLGLQPNPEQGTITVDPLLPDEMGFLNLTKLELYSQSFSIEAAGNQANVYVSPLEQMLQTPHFHKKAS